MAFCKYLTPERSCIVTIGQFWLEQMAVCMWGHGGNSNHFLPLVLALVCESWRSVQGPGENVVCLLLTCQLFAALVLPVLEQVACPPLMLLPNCKVQLPPWTGWVTSWQGDWNPDWWDYQSLAVVHRQPPGGSGRGRGREPGHMGLQQRARRFVEVLCWLVAVQLRWESWSCWTLYRMKHETL